MPTRRDTEIAAFRSAIAETPELWRSLDVRTVAVRLGDEWHNMLTRCALDARAPSDVPALAHLPETPALACWQEVRPAADLDVVISDLTRGVLRVAGHDVAFRPLVPNQEAAEFKDGPYEDGYAMIAQRLPVASTVIGPRELIGHALGLRPGGSMRSLSAFAPGGDRAVAQTLQSLEHPWDGLGSLGRVALRSAHDLTRSDSPFAEIVAPLGAAFEPDTVRLAAGALTGTVWAASAATAAECAVGYIAEREDGSFENGTVRFAKRWRGRSQRRATLALSLGSAVRRVTLLLRIGPHLVDRAEVLDRAPRVANPHVAAYEVMDPGLARLRAALAVGEAEARGSREKKDGQRLFERAVAQLFSLAGLHADALGGYTGMDDAVDVLVRTAGGETIFPVECTIGALATRDGKPNRLLERAEALRRARALVGAEVVPAMVTSRPRAAVPKGDFEFVAHDRVVVLCQEELQEMTNMIERGASTSDVVRYCRQFVPVTAAEAHRAHGLMTGRGR